MSAGAVVLLLLAYDLKTVRRILPFDFIYVAGVGLLVAILTGMGSFLFEHLSYPMHLVISNCRF